MTLFKKVKVSGELGQLQLHYIAAHKHPTRNRAMFLMTTNCGMRVGEVAALRLCDVLTTEGKIRESVYLRAEQTKGSKGRTVILSEKIQEELHNYLCSRFKLKDLLAVTLTDTTRALFTNQKIHIVAFRQILWRNFSQRFMREWELMERVHIVVVVGLLQTWLTKACLFVC